MDELMTVVFNSNYATVYFMDKPMFDVIFSHALYAELNMKQKEILLTMISDLNKHHTSCSNAA